jgi:hypothetical protein
VSPGKFSNNSHRSLSYPDQSLAAFRKSFQRSQDQNNEMIWIIFFNTNERLDKAELSLQTKLHWFPYPRQSCICSVFFGVAQTEQKPTCLLTQGGSGSPSDKDQAIS